MTYITDEQLEKATEQFASALTNKKAKNNIKNYGNKPGMRESLDMWME